MIEKERGLQEEKIELLTPEKTSFGSHGGSRNDESRSRPWFYPTKLRGQYRNTRENKER